MNNDLFDKEFYPTPSHIAYKMVEPYVQGRATLDKRQILEPSAGNGAILDVLCGETLLGWKRARKNNVYAIEQNSELQYVLQGKGYRLLCDDFLTYKPLHSFDLIVMNPPFSNGDEHLLHAWDIMHTGDIVCLLNAETIKNPYTQRRQLLAKIIESNGSVEYLGNCFAQASRKTDVDVAMVRLHKEQTDTRWHIDFDDTAKKDSMPDFAEAVASGSALAINDKLGSYLHAWDKAQEVAVDFIKAYKKLDFYVTAFMPSADVAKMVGEQLKGMQDDGDMARAYNIFLDTAKSLAWRTIIANMGMDKYMTANLRKTFDQFCEAQGAYELNRENISKLMQFVCLNSGTIMKKAVADVYDMFIRFYKGNSALEEGWKTNNQFKVNKKVILPYFVDTSWSAFYHSNYSRFDEYRDIDKVMCYLSGKRYEDMNKLTEEARAYLKAHPGANVRETADDYTCLSLEKAVSFVKVGDNSWHESEFFKFRCFKKGTLHIVFKDEDLWARFNLAVCEGKNMLGNQ